MTRAEVFANDIQKLDNEIRKMEQLNMTGDKLYCLLQMERAAKVCELEYCLENNL